MNDEMSEDEIELYKSEIEKEFDEYIEQGKDIGCFVYFPREFLSDRVLRELDVFMMNKTYNAITAEKFSVETFCVFEDNNVKVSFDTIESRIELLDKLINFFKQEEEYEKCSRLLEILKKVNNSG